MKKLVVTLAIVITILNFTALTCLAAEEKAAAADKPAAKAAMGKGKAAKMASAKAPIVKLERVEIANYWGFYFDAKEKRGAPLNLAFIYSIENSNNFKIALDSFKFNTSFEGFELNISSFQEQNSIPARTNDHFRYNVVLDAWIANSTLNVQNRQKLTEMNITSTDLLKKWWEGIADFNFPITVNGTANFVGPDGKTIIVPFEATFPEKK